MNLSQLQVLVAIAETGSFTNAAERIGLTQSAASHALANLEKELGVALLERTRSGVCLTVIGQQVLHHARAMLHHEEAIRQETAAVKGLAMGKIRVGTFGSTAARLLPSILRNFRHRYPNIDVILFEGADEEIYTWIDNGVVDIGFVTQLAMNVTRIPLMQDEMHVVVAEQHPLSHYATIDPVQLLDEPFIVSGMGCSSLIQMIFEQMNATLKPRFVVNDVSTILAMVQEDLGVTIVPRMSLPDTLAGVTIRSLNPPFYRDLALGVRSPEAITPAVRVFIEMTQQTLASWLTEPQSTAG